MNELQICISKQDLSPVAQTYILARYQITSSGLCPQALQEIHNKTEFIFQRQNFSLPALSFFIFLAV